MDLIPGLPNDVAFECLIRIPFHQFPKASSVCRTWNAVIKQPEFRRRRQTSALTRPVIVMAQAMVGLSGLYPPVYRLTLFEPVKGRWYDFPPIPEMVEGLPVFTRVVGIGSELAVIGGCDPGTWRVLNSVFIYNFLSGTWRRGTDMPGEQRLFFGCAASEEDGTVVVAGGHDGDKNSLRSTLAYEVARDRWTPLPDMSSGRDECTCVFHGGKFHVVGGYDVEAQGQFKQTAETLDLVARQWRLTDKITDASNMSSQATYVEIGGRMYTVSGSGDVVALEDAKWVLIARVPDEICNVAYVTGWQGRMMVIGNAKYGEAHRVYVLEVKSKKWKKIESPSEYCGHVQSGSCIEL